MAENIKQPTETNVPNPAKMVNIVSKIPPEKQLKIATEIITDRDTDIDSRKDWADKRDRAYKLWTLHREPKIIPWENCSNVCIPIMSTAVNQFHGRAYQSIFAAPELVKVLPVGKNDVLNARNVENYMNWQIRHEMEEYEDVMDKLLLNLPINGTAFKKIVYSKALQRPVSDYISALDLILPYKTKSLETARRKTHQLWLHWDELLDRREEGLYEFEDGELNETPSDDNKEEALEETKKKVEGTEPDKQKEEPHLILECHKKYDLGDGRKPYVFTVDKDTKTLMRVVSREYKIGSEKKVMDYFTDYHFIPNPEGFYSFGFGHFLEVLNEMANRAFNIIFDSGSLTNQPFGFYGRRVGFKKKTIKLKPGEMIPVEDATQVSFPKMQRVDQILFLVLGLINDYTANFTSVTEAILGREHKGVERPTARGTQALIEQGLTTFSVIVKRTYRGMKKDFKSIKFQNELFLPDSKEYRIMGSTQKIAFADIKRSEFSGVADIVPVADPSFASKQIRRQEALGLHEVTMQNPLVIGTPPPKEGGEPAIKPNLRAMLASTRNLYAAFEEPHTEKLIEAIEGAMPPEPVPPEEENSMFMQGDYVVPKIGENHQEHYDVHVGFSNTETYKKMPDNFKLLLTTHLTATQKVAQIELAQKAQANIAQQQQQAGATQNA
jgi:hypothetical protein